MAYTSIEQSKEAKQCAQSGNALSFGAAEKVYQDRVRSHIRIGKKTWKCLPGAVSCCCDISEGEDIFLFESELADITSV